VLDASLSGDRITFILIDEYLDYCSLCELFVRLEFLWNPDLFVNSTMHV
jgi:hypothetical protein